MCTFEEKFNINDNNLAYACTTNSDFFKENITEFLLHTRNIYSNVYFAKYKNKKIVIKISIDFKDYECGKIARQGYEYEVCAYDYIQKNIIETKKSDNFLGYISYYIHDSIDNVIFDVIENDNRLRTLCKSSKCIVLITEYYDNIQTLYDYMTNLNNTKNVNVDEKVDENVNEKENENVDENVDETTIILIQLLHILYVMESEKISHNDLHFNNILVKIHDTYKENCVYIYHNKYIFYSNIQLLLYDWNMSYISALGDNDLLNNFGVFTNSVNSKLQILQLLNSLYDFQEPVTHSLLSGNITYKKIVLSRCKRFNITVNKNLLNSNIFNQYSTKIKYDASLTNIELIRVYRSEYKFLIKKFENNIITEPEYAFKWNNTIETCFCFIKTGVYLTRKQLLMFYSEIDLYNTIGNATKIYFDIEVNENENENENDLFYLTLNCYQFHKNSTYFESDDMPTIQTFLNTPKIKIMCKN